MDSRALEQDKGWVRVRDLPLIHQDGSKDCGAATLASVLSYWGRPVSPKEIEHELVRGPEEGGFRAGDLAKFAEKRGFEAFVFHGTLEDLRHEVERGRPVIVGLAKAYDSRRRMRHYEVFLGYNTRSGQILTFDPARGLRQNSVAGFMNEWEPTERVVVVLFERAQDDAEAALPP